MPWFNVDDQLHDHAKARKAGKAAMGVWVLAGSWSMDNKTDGFIPAGVLSRWGTRADAGRLVAAGLWFVDEHNDERGWRFHDWFHRNPSAETIAAWKAAESDAGQRGNHQRWHVKRNVSDPDCPYCYQVPDHPPDEVPDRVDIGSTVGSASPSTQAHTQVSPNGETPSVRTDVERVCDHLARRIEQNGSKRPTITARWRDAARLMLDRDGRSEAEVMRAIDWCQTGTSQSATFWRTNVLSMPKLREKFDQMRLQAEREQAAPQRQTRVQEHLALVAELQDRERNGAGIYHQIGPAS